MLFHFSTEMLTDNDQTLFHNNNNNNISHILLITHVQS